MKPFSEWSTYEEILELSCTNFNLFFFFDDDETRDMIHHHRFLPSLVSSRLGTTWIWCGEVASSHSWDSQKATNEKIAHSLDGRFSSLNKSTAEERKRFLWHWRLRWSLNSNNSIFFRRKEKKRTSTHESILFLSSYICQSGIRPCFSSLINNARRKKTPFSWLNVVRQTTASRSHVFSCSVIGI